MLGVAGDIPYYFDTDLDTIRVYGRFYHIYWTTIVPTGLTNFLWGNCITLINRYNSSVNGFQFAFGNPDKLAFRMYEGGYWRTWTILK